MKFFGFLGQPRKTSDTSRYLTHGYQTHWDEFSFSHENLHVQYATLSKESVLHSYNAIIFLDGKIYEIEKRKNVDNIDESLCRAINKWGFKAALNLINGDFALVYWDKKNHELWMARDRFGVKPLYFRKIGNEIAFCSRIKPLLVFDTTGVEYNSGFIARFAASHYRYFDNFPNESPYANIQQLPAAHWLRWKNGKISMGRYWDLIETEKYSDSADELSERYRDIFVDSVRIRQALTTSPAFSLSGGMDSSSVLASAVTLTNNKQHAFSCVYQDKTFDESKDIRAILEPNVAEWHRAEIGSPDVMGLVDKLISSHDEPVATATWLAHWVLCEKASNLGFKEIFGGLGGDELNAGEYEYFFYFFADLFKNRRDALFQNEVEAWAKHHDHPVYRKSLAVVKDYFTHCIDFNNAGRCLPDVNRLSRYFDALNPEFFSINRFQPEMEHPFFSYLDNRTYQDLTRETLPCCLRAEDRQSTAHGLSNMLPFLDHRLVEFMFRIPLELKIRNGVTKYLLRMAMRNILPEETRTRIKKTGWNAPAHQWFSGSGADELRDLVASQSFREMGIYDVKRVEKIIVEHQEIVENRETRENHMMFLWQLVNLWTWLSKHNL